MKRIFLIIVLLGWALGLILWIRGILLPSETVIVDPEIPTSSGLTPTMELANSVWSHATKWNDVIVQKSEEAQTDSDALKQLAFAQSFVGDLRSAEERLDQYCQNIPDDSACRKIEYVFDIAKPVDNTGKPLSWLTFEVLGKPSTAQSFSGQSTLSDNAYKNTVLRTKITKKGYTDFVSKTMHTAWSDDVTSQKNVAIVPVMIPADTSVTKKQIEAYQVKTKNYTFTVQPDTFVYADGSVAEWDIEVYFFDITADTSNAYASGMFSLDIFDSFTGTNMGEGMETYGMPLVKAYKWDVELFTSKPIIGVGRMSNMDNFKEKNGLQEIDFTKIPKNTPLDLTLASQYGLPPFWQYQKRTGTWETSSFQVLDNTGLSQFSFQDL